MALALVCPSCKFQTVASDSSSGDFGTCPRCEKRSLVPHVAREADTIRDGPVLGVKASDSGIAASVAPKNDSFVPPAPEEAAKTILLPPTSNRPAGTTRLKGPSSDEERAILSEVARAQADPRSQFGRFVLLGEIGKGGMGVVYRAWDARLRRIVALKMLLSVGLTDQAAIERFYREAETVARLRHPNIVSVFEVGEEDGKHYLAMDYIDGATLERRLRGNPKAETLTKARPDATRLPLTRAIEVLRDVARAVHYAHEQGVIHRDLKPHNIMLDRKDHPYVLDFGLARVAHQGTRLTKSGAALGTPAYMPPEQATGRTGEISERTDVYSLGATLYHVLTGRPPFDGASEYNVIWSLLTLDAVPPASLNRRVAGDLETICLKCLEKQPEKRYPSAEALAQDLDNYLAGEPISARPVGSFVRLVRKARRHKLVTALSVLCALSLLAGIGVAARYAREASLAVEHEKQQEDERKEREANGRVEEAERLKRATDRVLARVYLERSQRATAEGRYSEAAILAAKALTIEDLPAYRAALLIAREGAYKKPRRLANHVAWCLHVSPNGRVLASGGLDHKIKLWDLDTGHLDATLEGHESDVLCLAWKPDGTQIVSGGADGELRIWDVAKRAPVETGKLPRHEGEVFAVAWSRNGKLLASSGADREVHVLELEVEAGHTYRPTPGHEDEMGRAKFLAFSPDGNWLACACLDHAVRLFDTGTWEKEATKKFVRHLTPVMGVGWTPDGRRVTSVGLDQTVLSWDPEELRVIDTCGGAGARTTYYSSALDRSARLCAVGRTDGTIRVFDSLLARAVVTLTTYDTGAQAVAFTPDAKGLVTESADGKLRFWNLGAGEHQVRVLDAGHEVREVLASPDGKTLLASTRDGLAHIYDIASGKRTAKLGDDEHHVHSLSLNPDGTKLAGASGKTILIWDMDSGKQLATLAGHEDNIDMTAWSADGKTIASAGVDKTVRVWDAEKGELRSTLRGHALLVTAIAISKDGRRLVSASGEGKMKVWDLEKNVEVASPAGHPDAITNLAFSPDQKLVVTASQDHLVKLWDTTTWKERAVLSGHQDGVLDVAFSPDGARLATTSADLTIRIWDVEKGAQLVTIPGAANVNAVTFTKDGKWLVGGSADRIVELWPLEKVFSGPPPAEVLRDAERETGLRVADGALDPSPVLETR